MLNLNNTNVDGIRFLVCMHKDTYQGDIVARSVACTKEERWVMSVLWEEDGSGGGVESPAVSLERKKKNIRTPIP